MVVCVKVMLFQYGICNLRLWVNSVLYVKCSMLIHSIHVGVKGVTLKVSRNFAFRKCEGNIGKVG